MIRFILITLVTLIFIQSIHSQETIIPEQRIGLHIMPLGIVDPYSRFRFGIDYDGGKNIGFSIDYGIGTYPFIKTSKTTSDGVEEFDEYSLFEIRPEVKFYVNRKKRSSWYFATEMFFVMKQKVYKNDYFYEEDSGNTIYYENANYNVKKMGLHLKAGVEIIAADIMKFDFYVGIGLADREKYYTEVVYDYEADIYSDNHSSLTTNYRKEGKTIIPHLTGGIKIGVIIFKKKYEQ